MNIASAADLGRLIRASRSSRGLTQQGLATLAGVNRSTLIDMEMGRNSSLSTAMKVLSLLQVRLSATGAGHKRDLRWTAAKASREIKRELDAGDPSFAMRVVFMAMDSLSTLDEPERLQFLQEPPSTGRIRWDALLARAIAFKCHQIAVEPPPWTNVQPLRQTWYATPRRHVSQAWKARMASNTPPEFSASNIMMDARELASL